MASKKKPAAHDTTSESSTAPAPEQNENNSGAAEAASGTGGSNTKEPGVVALLVSAKVDGFRRAGRAWSRAQTRVEVAELSADEEEALLREPMLDVVFVAE